MPVVTMTPAAVGAQDRACHGRIFHVIPAEITDAAPLTEEESVSSTVVTSHGHTARGAMRDQGQPHAAPKSRASPRHPQLLTCY